MNREILFRGKRVDNSEWVDGYYLHAHGNSKMLIDRTPSNPEHWVFENMSFDSHLICTFIPPDTQGWDYNEQVFFHKVIPKTIGQFTGLPDKNGNRIFEHDIVTDNVGNDGIIKWDHLNCRFIIFWDGASNECLIKWLSESIEITGNIHENK